MFISCFEAGPGVKICIMDMLDEFTEIKKLKQRPELAHRIDKYVFLLAVHWPFPFWTSILGLVSFLAKKLVLSHAHEN